MHSEKENVALRVLEAIAAHHPIPEHDAFQVRYWVSPEEALLSLNEIGQLILRRELNSKTLKAG